MRTLLFDGQLKLADIEIPKPLKGEVLIKVLYSSICNTDIELTKGYMDFYGTPGHEFVGEVISETSSLFKKKVVGEINCSCGKCVMCRKNRTTHCLDRTVLGIYRKQGVFAEYITLPEHNLHVIPEDSDIDITDYIFTEPLAAAYEIFEQTHITSNDKIFIFGTGKLGILVSLLCKRFGMNYTAFNKNDYKIKVCSSLGINSKNISELSFSDYADICIDCSGNPEGLNLSINHLYPRGKLVLKSTIADKHKIDFNQIIVNELELIGSRCGPFKPALNLINQNIINFKPLVSKIFSFENILEAFNFANTNKNIFKIIIKH
ncbi:alcohol dehydrogenase catalytic domain-containing protein [Candidatus Dependentiae bacterium]|nr:alcohol dehydrogenase catalytic domain-containing protein [Candidatus Dependentiae bacterium]